MSGTDAPPAQLRIAGSVIRMTVDEIESKLRTVSFQPEAITLLVMLREKLSPLASVVTGLSYRVIEGESQAFDKMVEARVEASLAPREAALQQAIDMYVDATMALDAQRQAA